MPPGHIMKTVEALIRFALDVTMMLIKAAFAVTGAIVTALWNLLLSNVPALNGVPHRHVRRGRAPGRRARPFNPEPYGRTKWRGKSRRRRARY